MSNKTAILKRLEERKRRLEGRLEDLERLIEEERIREDEPGREEAQGGARSMAAWRWGKLPRGALTSAQRSEIMRELASRRRAHGGGRPRTVEHKPGPRGGCRCADCRAQGRGG